MTFQVILIRYHVSASPQVSRLNNYFQLQIFLHIHPPSHILYINHMFLKACHVSHLCDSRHVVFYVCCLFLQFFFYSPLKFSSDVISWEVLPDHPSYLVRLLYAFCAEFTINIYHVGV